MELQIVDLDRDKNTLISVTYNGERKVLSQSDVLELLALRARALGSGPPITTQTTEVPPKRKTKTLASLGAILGPLLRSREISEDVQQRLLVAIQNFDGNISGRRTSQVGHWLRDLLEKKLESELRNEIISFLKQYPDLENIPRRQT